MAPSILPIEGRLILKQPDSASPKRHLLFYPDTAKGGAVADGPEFANMKTLLAVIKKSPFNFHLDFQVDFLAQGGIIGFFRLGNQIDTLKSF